MMSGVKLLCVLGFIAFTEVCSGYEWDKELSRISTLRKLGYSKWRRQAPFSTSPTPPSARSSPPTPSAPTPSAPTPSAPTPSAPTPLLSSVSDIPSGPPMMPRLLFDIDNLIMKYTLGLSPAEGDDFDPAALAAAYFNIYAVIGDEDITTAQFVKTLALKIIQTRNNCMVSRIGVFVQMSIGAVIQEGWRAVVNWLPPILEDLIPDLALKSIDIRNEIPEMLGKMLIWKSLAPFSRRLLPIRFIANFTVTFKTELQNAADPQTFGDRIATLLTDQLNTDVPVCPRIENLAEIFQEELPNLSNGIGGELLDIVARLRHKLELRGVDIPDVSAIDALFQTIEPFVQDGLQYVCGEFATGNPQDIVNAINMYGVDLPDDLFRSLKSCDSKSVFILQQIEDFLIGYDGPFRQLMDELEGIHLGIP